MCYIHRSYCAPCAEEKIIRRVRCEEDHCRQIVAHEPPQLCHWHRYNRRVSELENQYTTGDQHDSDDYRGRRRRSGSIPPKDIRHERPGVRFSGTRHPEPESFGTTAEAFSKLDAAEKENRRLLNRLLYAKEDLDGADYRIASGELKNKALNKGQDNLKTMLKDATAEFAKEKLALEETKARLEKEVERQEKELKALKEKPNKALNQSNEGNKKLKEEIAELGVVLQTMAAELTDANQKNERLEARFGEFRRDHLRVGFWNSFLCFGTPTRSCRRNSGAYDHHY